MKLVCVYTPGQLREQTYAAIRDYWHHDMSLVQIPQDDHQAYVKILSQLWQEQEGFFVVEPDIVIREDVVEAVLNCECWYGCFPYPWLTDVGPALGCTWFRAEFIQEYPLSMKKVLLNNISWNQLDVVLMRHVLVREYGQQPHIHLPPVIHLNESKQLLPSANPEPLRSLPAW